ncbi:MAG: glycerate kinase, partial [Hyperthermus sp.]
MKNADIFSSDPRGRILVEALEAGLDAVEPKAAMRRVLHGGACVRVGERQYCPGPPVYVVGFGKASRGMAEAVVEILDVRVEGGFVIAPHGMGGKIGPILVAEGDHPVPGEKTLRSSMRLVEFLADIPPNSLLLVLISGGGSSLFEIPFEGLDFDEIRRTVHLLLASGADIFEINAVRKHLSRVKGGQLLRYTKAALIETIVISDVVGDDVSTIASGPTVPDPTTFKDALEALSKHNILNKVPQSVRKLLEKGAKGELPETPKPGDPIFHKTYVTIAARNRDALAAAAASLKAHGVEAVILTDTLRGEAREAGKVLASLLEALHRGISTHRGQQRAILAGGETTVKVTGKGVGGRNQELCLSLALELHRLRLLSSYKAACMGTDGVDGSSPAAGAIVDETTIPVALGRGMNPWSYLANNDTYTFFYKLNTIIDTGGYTGTNVNDIFIALT